MADEKSTSGPLGRRPRKKTGQPKKPVVKEDAPEPNFPDVDPVDPVGFSHFNLDPVLLENIGRLGFENPTPIQEQAIPIAMKGKDVLGLAQTGTGKTAAFLLPVLNRLMQSKDDSPGARVLILSPTRELALQIEKHFLMMAHNTGFSCVCIIGGQKMGGQLAKLKNDPEFLIATPGRLLDHFERGTASAKTVQYLIVDECDRMLDMGFMPDVKRIFRRVPAQRQTLMFSATLPSAIRQLCAEVQYPDAETVQIDIGKLPEGVKHTLYRVPQKFKTDLLLDLLKDKDIESVLIFTRTKHRADLLHYHLNEAGFSVTKIHGDLSMNDRLKALQAFRDRKYIALVATDLASRGLDVKDITHVINYDVPLSPEDYMHRVGRTARAQTEGDAFTFAAIEEESDLSSIEKLLGNPIPLLHHPEYHYPGDLPPSTNKGPVLKQKGRGLMKSVRRRRRR